MAYPVPLASTFTVPKQNKDKCFQLIIRSYTRFTYPRHLVFRYAGAWPCSCRSRRGLHFFLAEMSLLLWLISLICLWFFAQKCILSKLSWRLLCLKLKPNHRLWDVVCSATYGRKQRCHSIKRVKSKKAYLTILSTYNSCLSTYTIRAKAVASMFSLSYSYGSLGNKKGLWFSILNGGCGTTFRAK